MLILVINCGSSSAKYQLFDVAGEKSLAKGIVERIGQADSSLKHEKDDHSSLHQRVLCHDHHAAIDIIVEILMSKRYGVISSKHDIGGIGHRVVHGGE
ncbi:MAG: acetate kinase, partial [Candidatus Omnitrophica bacterium]|nr:acetate kinase [Candidatus Omnitrophota bacterium]